MVLAFLPRSWCLFLSLLSACIWLVINLFRVNEIVTPPARVFEPLGDLESAPTIESLGVLGSCTQLPDDALLAAQAIESNRSLVIITHLEMRVGLRIYRMIYSCDAVWVLSQPHPLTDPMPLAPHCNMHIICLTRHGNSSVLCGRMPPITTIDNLGDFYRLPGVTGGGRFIPDCGSPIVQ